MQELGFRAKGALPVHPARADWSQCGHYGPRAVGGSPS